MHRVSKLHFNPLLQCSGQLIKWQKNTKPFTDFERLISLQQTDSIETGHVLHSKTVAVDIIEHVSSQMKKKLLTKIVEKIK